MKKLFCSFGIFALLFASEGFAVEKDPLRANDSVVVNEGFVAETAILSDPEGIIFLEFLKGTYTAVEEAKTGFDGEIMPPEIIEVPARPPRARMKEFLTFELLTDSGDDVVFVDRFALKPDKNKLREEVTNPDQFFQRPGAAILTRISTEDKVALPTLWEFKGEEFATEKCSIERSVIRRQKCVRRNLWRRIGGKLEESEEPEISIFSAIFTKTGIYAIFDENPSPDFVPPFPIDEIEAAEESPFPSVEPSSASASAEASADRKASEDMEGGEEMGEESEEIPPFIDEEEGAPLEVPASDNPFSGIPGQAGGLVSEGVQGAQNVIPSLPEDPVPISESAIVPALPEPGVAPAGAPGEAVPLAPLPTEGNFQSVTPGIVSGEVPAIEPAESPLEPIEEIIEEPAELDPELSEELEIEEGSELPKSGSFKFPFVMVLAFLFLVASGYFAFEKQRAKNDE